VGKELLFWAPEKEKKNLSIEFFITRHVRRRKRAKKKEQGANPSSDSKSIGRLGKGKTGHRHDWDC